jgi:hypothetical protein
VEEESSSRASELAGGLQNGPEGLLAPPTASKQAAWCGSAAAPTPLAMTGGATCHPRDPGRGVGRRMWAAACDSSASSSRAAAGLLVGPPVDPGQPACACCAACRWWDLRAAVSVALSSRQGRAAAPPWASSSEGAAATRAAVPPSPVRPRCSPGAGEDRLSTHSMSSTAAAGCRDVIASASCWAASAGGCAPCAPEPPGGDTLPLGPTAPACPPPPPPLSSSANCCCRPRRSRPREVAGPQP